MSTPNEPRDPSTPDDRPTGDAGTPDAPPPPPAAPGQGPSYPAGTSPDAPGAPGAGQPPYGTGAPGYGASTPGYGAATPGQPPAYGAGDPAAYGQAPAYGGYEQGAAGYGAPASTARNSLGVWSLVLGIVSILTCCLVVGVIPGAIGIWLGIRGRGAAKRGEATNGGLSLTGIILGVLGVLAGLYFLVSIVVGIAQYGGWDGFLEYVQTEVERQQQTAP